MLSACLWCGNVGAPAPGAIKIMLFVLKQPGINRAEGGRSYRLYYSQISRVVVINFEYLHSV